jgi:GntR family transcriptional regulator
MVERKRMPIDRDSSIPSYVQVADNIRGRIVSGEFPPGKRLPTERELISESGLSRITIRQGLALLERDGWVVRKQGLGTFVRNSIDQELTSVRTITEVLIAKGMIPEIRVLSFARVVPPPNVQKRMELAADERVLCAKRLYRYKKQPIALIYIYLPLSVWDEAQILRNAATPTDTTYTIWEDRLHVRLKNAHHVIRAGRAAKEDARALRIPVGAAILILERTTYADDERPVECVIFHYHPEVYEFSATLPRTRADTGQSQFGLNGRYVGPPATVVGSPTFG